MKQSELQEFAQRVERMCDFFLAKIESEVGRDGSNDLKIIENLKEDAANIQFERVSPIVEIGGLYEYMNGIE